MAAAAATSLSFLSSQAYLEGKSVKDSRALVSDLCRHFCSLARVTGTGGSSTGKPHDDSVPKTNQLIVMSPSRVQKERMVLSVRGEILSVLRLRPYPNKPPKCTDCAPLFTKAYQVRNAGAVIHSHGMKSFLVTVLHSLSKEFRAECYHYLFDAAIKLHHLGIDWTTPRHGPLTKERHLSSLVRAEPQNGYRAIEPSRLCIILDIEGTTTPISFVTDILFPYARDNVRNHLLSTYDSKETKDDIDLLRAQVKDDLEKGAVGSVPIPPDDAGKTEVIESLVTNVEAMIKADRKLTALKQVQGHIWRTGFQNNQLQGVVFEDVPKALKRWHANGIKVYIYSSGSREAQRLIFGNTTFGDLRKYLCGFFDTTIGNKREANSYFEILQSVGVDKPSQILFVTDVYQEAEAAKTAGLEVIISIRPGNAPLPENHGFATIRSFAEI